MPPKKHESEEEKTVNEIIAEEIAKRFVPIYWGLGTFGLFVLGLIFTMTGPLFAEVIDQSKKVEAMITTERAFDRFVTKDQYHQLQKEEHISDIDATKNNSIKSWIKCYGSSQ